MSTSGLIHVRESCMNRMNFLRCFTVIAKLSAQYAVVNRFIPILTLKLCRNSNILAHTFKMAAGKETLKIEESERSESPSHKLADTEEDDQIKSKSLSQVDTTDVGKNSTADADNSNQMTRREKKRAKRQLQKEEFKERKRHKRMKILDSGGSTSNKEPNLEEEYLDETSYYFENGLRKVYPYYYTFGTHAKGRWYNRTIIDVMSQEMGMFDRNYYEKAIEMEMLTINGKPTTMEYQLQNGDRVEHLVHRHETPVMDKKIEILADTDDLLVINKPASIPVHPCGRFRHNTLTYILAKEYNKKNLRGVHRLDRATSGVLIFAKTHKKAEEVMKLISSRQVEKEYLCRVEGEFPKDTVICDQPLQMFSGKLSLHRVNPDGKEAKTTFDRLSFNGISSVVKCKPLTGRTHQIRVHLQYLGFPIANDPLYNTEAWGAKKGKGCDYGKSEELLLEDLAKVHDPKNYIVTTKDVDPRKTSHPEGSTFEIDKLTVDENCDQCKTLFMDPDPKLNVLYLHAYRYKGPDFEFQTNIPVWAEEDWKE